MIHLFITVLKMSLTASYAALAVMLVRLFLKKAPKIFSYILWAVVLFRLICPFSFESVFSLMPVSTHVIPQQIIHVQDPVLNGDAGTTDKMVNNPIPNSQLSVHPEASFNATERILWLASYLWILGVIILFCYGVFSYLRLKRRLSTAILVQDNIYETDRINTPFVFGFIHPKIYVPVRLEVKEPDYILRHERVHIKRRDYLIKPVAFMALIIHWFNPVIWFSFVLMVKDMEMSCDEKVMKQSKEDIRGLYSHSLLSLSVKQSGLISPLAFGENNIKARIKNILNYQCPAFWLVIVAAVAVVGVAITLMANPQNSAILENNFMKEIYQYRTEYVGNNGKVVNIADRLPVPETLKRDQIQLFTKEKPYTVEVNYETTSSEREYFSGAANQAVFDQNAILMFALIGNVEYVNFVLDDGKQVELIQRTRAWADNYMGQDVWKASVTLEQFTTLYDDIRNKLVSNSDFDDLYFLLNSGKKTKKSSVNDVPMAVKYEKVEARGEIYYIYEEQGKYYAEKPYRFISELTEQTYNKIRELMSLPGLQKNGFSQQIIDLVENNLKLIMSSPQESSNPNDYFKAHQNEYENIIKYGKEEALEYMLFQFEEGKAEGLRGQLLMALCKELLSERNNVKDETLSPQSWYKQLKIRQEIVLSDFSYDGTDPIEKLVYETEIEKDKTYRAGFTIVAPHIFGSYQEENKLKVFVTTFSSHYRLYDKALAKEGGSVVPVAITYVKNSEGSYVLEKYEQAGDGSYFGISIKKFCTMPVSNKKIKGLADKILAHYGDYGDIIQLERENLIKHLKMNNQLGVSLYQKHYQKPVELIPLT